MNKFLEAVMNFINENTILLIIICVFLIFVLIGYLIDNSIKARKLEKQAGFEKDNNSNQIPINTLMPNELENKVESKEEINSDFIDPSNNPIINTNEEEELNFKTYADKTSENLSSEEKSNEENKLENTVVEELPSSENLPQTNEIVVDPKINDLLLRGFENNITNENNTQEEATLNPIENIASIDDLNDINNIEDSTIKIPEIEKNEESKYKNDKKISDIFKKKEDNQSSNIDKTQDYSDELDKILKKINDNSSNITNDGTLEETTDFTNMF